MCDSRSSGFSLLEVLISILVLSIGVLAIVRSLAAMGQMVAVGAVLTRAAVIGANHMETMMANGCAGSAAVSTTVQGFRINAHVTSQSEATRIDVILRYPVEYIERIDSLSALVVCPDEA